MTSFPSDFLWGSATAAHQVEGGNVNSDWWEWEHRAASKAEESSGDGIDHWNRYDDDFALLASLGQNAHRLSLEWARIEPAPGEFSSAAIDHYRRVLESLHRRGLTPFVTLYHFSIPRWFAERGGWRSPEAVDVFGRYAAHVCEALGDLMTYVGTINEPQVVSAMGYLAGVHPPGLQDLEAAREVNQVLAGAHRTAVGAVRAGRGRPLVGTCLHIPWIEPLRPDDSDDIAVAERLRRFFLDTHVEDLRSAPDPGDFVGLQYYSRDRADATSASMTAGPPEDAEVNQLGWEVHPHGFRSVLHQVAESGLPVIVTENGIATLDDDQRVRFLSSHLAQLEQAMDEGVDIRGYFHWSAFDNYEWGTYEPRFGLIGIDREDGYRRIVRPSAVHYGHVARTGRLDQLHAAARSIELASGRAAR